MDKAQILINEYASLQESIREYEAGLANDPTDWILALHLSRARNRLSFLESKLPSRAA